MFKSLFRALFGEGPEPRCPRTKTSRLKLEVLEDRELLANLTFVGNGVGAGANWSVDANWSPAQKPVAADTVYLDGAAGVGANADSQMDLGGIGRTTSPNSSFATAIARLSL